MTRPRTTLLVLAVAAAVAATAQPAHAARPADVPRGVLVALLLPYSEQDARGAVQLAVGRGGASAAAVWSSLRTGRRYGVALSRRTCAALRGRTGRGLLASTYGRSTVTSAGTVSPVNVDLLGLRRARSIVLLTGDWNDDGADTVGVVACGRARASAVRRPAGPIGSLAALEPVGDSGVHGVVNVLETPGRLRVGAGYACPPAMCPGFLLADGSVRFAAEPCGQPATTPLAEAPVSALTFQDVLVTSVRRLADGITRQARSIRLSAGDRELACGSNVPSRWATFPGG